MKKFLVLLSMCSVGACGQNPISSPSDLNNREARTFGQDNTGRFHVDLKCNDGPTVSAWFSPTLDLETVDPSRIGNILWTWDADRDVKLDWTKTGSDAVRDGYSQKHTYRIPQRYTITVDVSVNQPVGYSYVAQGKCSVWAGDVD